MQCFGLKTGHTGVAASSRLPKPVRYELRPEGSGCFMLTNSVRQATSESSFNQF